MRKRILRLNGKNRKSFVESFYNFISDPENLTQEEIRAELKDLGVDTDQLEMKVAEIVKYSRTVAQLEQ